MAVLWGGGAGHAGAGGTLPLRGAAEPVVGRGFSSTQYSLAEDLHLTSLEAETILEAEELLGTRQDYLDSSVISIIEDFSNLTETKGRMDAENELSLLTAITEILDSTDDEFLSPFDTIPDSELLASPRERDNSSFQRFLSFSALPPEQNFHTIDDFQEPRICTIMTEKVEASTASLPLVLTSSCPKDLAASKKPSSKAPRGEWRLFRHREREPPVLQCSDGEEEEEEGMMATGHGQGFVGSMKEISEELATKEAETDFAASDGPYIIAPESISLSELVRSMHTYCQPTFTVCLSPESQPFAEELLAGPVVLEVVPDGGESMEIPVILKNVEAELPCRTNSNCVVSHVNREAILLASALEEVLPADGTKTAGLNIEFAVASQAEGTSKTTLQGAEDACQGEERRAQRSADNESRSQPEPVAATNAELRDFKKGQRCGRTKKNRKRFSEETRWHKEVMTCRLLSVSSPKHGKNNPSHPVLFSGLDCDSPEKQLEEAGWQGQGKPLPRQTPQTVERMGTKKELLNETELQPKSPPALSLESAEALPCIVEHLSTQHQECNPSPTDQGDVQEPNNGSHLVLATNGTTHLEVSQLLPSSTLGSAGQPPRNLLSITSAEVSCPPKEAKPRPLSLSEYRQRRRQHQPSDRNAMANQSASKWPSLPELPTKLAELPCLVVSPPTPKVAMPGLAKEPEKPVDSSNADARADRSATPPSMPAPAASPAPVVPSSQLGCMSTASLLAPVPAFSSLPSKVGAFPPVGPQVLATLPPPYLPSTPGTFVPAPPNSYILGSPPVPSWSQFAPLPTGYQSLPSMSPATEACPPVFHTIPSVPLPSWHSPSIPLPPFAPGLTYGSVEWASGPQTCYWSSVPVPPPMLPMSYRDPSVLLQSHPVGVFPAPCPSEGTLVQQNTAPTPEPLPSRVQSLAAAEKPSLLVHVPRVQAPSAIKTAPRRVSDPRRQAVSSVAKSKTEVTSSSSQLLGKPCSPTSAVEPLGKTALNQPTRKSSIPQPLEELNSLPPSQQVISTLKSIEEPSSLPAFQPATEALGFSGPVEKAYTISAAQSAEQAASQPQEEECSPLPAVLVPEKVMLPTATEGSTKEAASTVPDSLTSTVPPKVPESDQLSKTLAQKWKRQPLAHLAQCNCNKDIVQAFINEIGIEASDLSSLLEQFEKTEAKKEPSSVTKSRGNITAGNDGSKAQQEKKTVDRLQAPELANIAGLTPPATPPHQLWKPLAAVSLLGKAVSSKGARLVKSLSRPHRKAAAPVHVGSGEHDYCQLRATQPKEGSRWNVKHNSDITIKPIAALTKQVPEQPAINQAPAVARLDPVGVLGMTVTYHNSKEAPSPIDAGQDQTLVSGPAAASLNSATSDTSQLKRGLTSPHRESLDHRTSTARSSTRGSSDDPCSILLSPAASPCRDTEEPTSRQPQEVQQKHLVSKRSLRCYRRRQKSTSPQKERWRGRRSRASRSFSSSSDEDSDSSSSSSSRSRSRSPSPPSKRWRRYHSQTSSSSSCDSSWSQSRSRSRSPSLHRRSSCRKRNGYDSSSSPDRYQRQKIRYKERAIEERRVVFIGKIPSRMTRSELRHRFSVFGDIEDCTLHFREQGDNYGFVTYRYAEEAFAAIEGGNALRHPDEQPFDLCFGGRRQFCKRNYVDLDSNREDFEPVPVKSKFDSLDFDTLLKQAQRSLRR